MAISSPNMDSRAIDFVIVTALPEERDAVLAKLPGFEKLPPSGQDIHTYYKADLPVKLSNGQTGAYTVIVMPLLDMGRVEAAIATKDAIQVWHPRYIMLVGIAGGISDQSVKIGDILISEQIVDYELQKVTPLGHEMRWKSYHADPYLLDASKNFTGKLWQKQLPNKRPHSQKIKCHFGPIASGDKVIAFTKYLARYRNAWPKLIGVEMEAAGVAQATFQSSERPGFFMVRCASDLADEKQGKPVVKKWRGYACKAAASFAIALLKSGPIRLNDETIMPIGKKGLPSGGGSEQSRSHFIYQRPVQGDEFIDRRDILRRIFNRLANGESVAVTGDPHTGKTSLIKQLADPEIQKVFVDKTTIRNWSFCYLSLDKLPDDYTPNRFWNQALQQIQGHTSHRAAVRRTNKRQLKQYDRHDLRHIFREFHSQHRKVIFLLDEFEQLLDHENFQTSSFFALLRSLSLESGIEGGLVLVISSRLAIDELSTTGHRRRNIGSPFLNHLTHETLFAFDDDAIEDLLNRATPAFSSEEKIFIQRVAGRNPFLLQVLAGTLYEIESSDDRVEKAAKEYYRRVGYHFQETWEYLDESARTAAVALSYKLLNHFGAGGSEAKFEIEDDRHLKRGLMVLEQRMLAELAGRTGRSQRLPSDRFIIWQDEKWMISCESFAWWILKEIIMIPTSSSGVGVTELAQTLWSDIRSLRS